jgi:hypothetical protein
MAAAVQVHQDVTKCGQRIARHLEAWRRYGDIWKSDKAALLDKFKAKAPATATFEEKFSKFKKARARALWGGAPAPGLEAWALEKGRNLPQVGRGPYCHSILSTCLLNPILQPPPFPPPPPPAPPASRVLFGAGARRRHRLRARLRRRAGAQRA